MENRKDNDISLKQALLDKYSEDQFEVENLGYISFSPKRKAHYHHPLDFSKRQVIALDDCQITCAGAEREIAALCPNVEELDLSKNHITDWKEVFSIISQLDQLTILNLSSNPLVTDDVNMAELMADFDCSNKHLPLKRIALNNTRVSFDAVYSLLECFPSIEELFLSLNEYSNAPSIGKTFPTVRHLYLNEHNFTDWRQIMNVGRVFPCLKDLIMTNSPLENILADDAHTLFPDLCSLSLNKTAICGWESIDALTMFPSLKDIRLSGIPLLHHENDKNKRQLLVARLPNVTKINGTRVGDQEREDDERFFVRRHINDQNPPKRLQELLNIHGAIDKLADINLDPIKFVNVSIIYDDKSPITREINLTQNNRDFQKFLSKELGVPGAKLRVFHLDNEGIFGMDEMKGMRRPLHAYHINEGDEIHVFPKDC